MSDSDFVYKSQDVNYLGFLEAQLRDMTGIDTLAYELIQNADDVQDEGARFAVTTLSFDVTDDALIVNNDGRFRACGFSAAAKHRWRRQAGRNRRHRCLWPRLSRRLPDHRRPGNLFQRPSLDHPSRRAGRPSALRSGRQKPAEPASDCRGPLIQPPIVRRTLRIEAVHPQQLDAFAQQIGEAVTLAALFLTAAETAGSQAKRYRHQKY